MKYNFVKRLGTVAPKTIHQFSTKLLFLIVLEFAVLFASFVNLPKAPGFNVQYSRAFFLGCLLGASIGSLVVTSYRYRITSWRFTQSLVISTIISSWIGYSAVLVHAGQGRAASGNWPGMAGAFLLPGSFLISAIAATVLSLLLPVKWLDALFHSGRNSKISQLRANARWILAIAASAVAMTATLMGIRSLEHPFFGRDQYVMQAVPYVLHVVFTILFRKATTGATTWLIGTVILGGLGTWIVYTAGKEIDNIGFAPVLLIVGTAILLFVRYIQIGVKRFNR